MGCSLSAISDDEDDYSYLCRKYGEEERTSRTSQGYGVSDCYGPHAALLEECRKTGKTPAQVRKARRLAVACIEVNADVNDSNRYYLHQHNERDEYDGIIWYAVDAAKRADWIEWLKLTAEEPKRPKPPSFVIQIIDIDTFTFSDPINQ